MLLAYYMTLFLVLPVILSDYYIKEVNNKTYKPPNKYVIGYVIFIFVIIIGFRDTASSSVLLGDPNDEFRYRMVFSSLTGTNFSLKNVQSLEWASYIVNWLLANIFKSSQVWVFAYALITNILYVKAIKKYVHPFWLGILIYITCGLFTFQMNGTMSVVAGAILTLAIEPAVKRNLLKYLLVVFVALGFHFSAIIMIPLYFVLTSKKVSRNFIIWSILSLFSMMGFQTLVNIILPGTPYEYYLTFINSDDSYGVNIFRIIIFVIIYLFIIMGSRKLTKVTSYEIYFLNSIVILIFINVVSLAYVYVYRFNELLIFASIVMLPNVLRVYSTKTRTLILLLIIIGFILFGTQQNLNTPYENILFKNLI